MKKIFQIILTIIVFLPLLACAIDLDYTVDDAIRKNYHVDEIKTNIAPKTTVNTKSDPLPKLPDPPKTVNSSVNNTKPQSVQASNVAKKTPTKYIPIRKGAEFEIVNINAISDKQKEGTNIVFVSKYPIRTPYYTFPQGTKFVGRITESHTPQLTGNGGLVSLEVITMIANGKYYHIDSRVTHVNNKKVYFEKIKGKRTYWKNTVKKGKWGRNTFHKTNKVSKSLAQDKTTMILSPFTFIYGTAVGAISTATSPVVSIFCKGNSISIPANTTFKIKLIKDTKIGI